MEAQPPASSSSDAGSGSTPEDGAARPDPEDGWTPQVKSIRQYNRRLLFTTLNSIEGTKGIIWSSGLMKRLVVYVTDAELKQHGVVFNTRLDLKKPVSGVENVVFFVEKSMEETTKLIDYIGSVKNEGALHHVFYIPLEWYAAKQKLKDQQHIWERLETVRALPLSWLPFEGDVVALDEPTLPSRVLLNGDWTVLHRCACALYELERMAGRPFIIHAKGKWSTDVANMLVKMRPNESSNGSGRSGMGIVGGGDIPAAGLYLGRLVLVDRWLDPLTPLLTPLTYAAMLDDVYGIGINERIKVPQAEFEQKNDGSIQPSAQMDLSLNDDVFHRCKHTYITALSKTVTDILADVLKEQQQVDLKNMSIAESLVFVKKLPALKRREKNAWKHFRLCEMLIRQMQLSLWRGMLVEKELVVSPDGDRVLGSIEDALLARRTPQEAKEVLRLIAIQSTTAGGLKTSVLQTYRKMVFQSFGVDALNRFIKMQKIGLIREKSAQRFVPAYPPLLFAQQCKAYNMLPTGGIDYHVQSDAAYAHSYVAPLLVRIVEEGSAVRWTGWATPKGNLGPSSDVRPLGPGSTVVFVVGGITRTEIAGLRRIKDIGLIAASSIVTRDGIVDNLTNIL